MINVQVRFRPERVFGANNIAQHSIAHWSKTIGGRSEVTVTPNP